jgi:hypothetical protein
MQEVIAPTAIEAYYLPVVIHDVMEVARLTVVQSDHDRLRNETGKNKLIFQIRC